MERLTDYFWPGNIRELQNIVERAVVISTTEVVDIDKTVLGIASESGNENGNDLEDVERRHIIRILDETNWVIDGKNGAAGLLNINPSTLRSRMQKLGIKRPEKHA